MNEFTCMRGFHHWEVEGTPRSKMTYYQCRDCGAKKPRGPGAFYKEPNAAGQGIPYTMEIKWDTHTEIRKGFLAEDAVPAAPSQPSMGGVERYKQALIEIMELEPAVETSEYMQGRNQGIGEAQFYAGRALDRLAAPPSSPVQQESAAPTAAKAEERLALADRMLRFLNSDVKFHGGARQLLIEANEALRRGAK